MRKEEFDAITGKFTESPRQAAEAVSERTAISPGANVGEGAISMTAAASNDLASRVDEDSERQHSWAVGFAGYCRTGGEEQSDASAAPVGDASADEKSIPATIPHLTTTQSLQ